MHKHDNDSDRSSWEQDSDYWYIFIFLKKSIKFFIHKIIQLILNCVFNIPENISKSPQ